MNEVRLPIKTSREDDKITKICVEDIYKVVNRIVEAMDIKDCYQHSILTLIKQKIEKLYL